MGFNTALMILNDRLHEITNDRQLGEKIRTAMYESDRNVHYFPYGKVLQTQHADTMQIIAVGGNTARVLGYGTWNQDDLTLIRALADKHGYLLTKKRNRAKKTPNKE